MSRPRPFPRRQEADPFGDRLERAIRHAQSRFGPGERPPPQDGAARRELVALLTDLDALIRDLKAGRASVRIELDAILAETRAGDAYRRTAALRTGGQTGRAANQGPVR